VEACPRTAEQYGAIKLPDNLQLSIAAMESPAYRVLSLSGYVCLLEYKSNMLTMVAGKMANCQ